MLLHAAEPSSGAESTSPPISRKERGLVIALLAIHVSAVLYQAAHDSPTWDEVGHFAAGLYYWKEGHFDLYCVNPPLPRLLGALPVLPFQPQLDLGRRSLTRHKRSEFAVGAFTIQANGERSFFLFFVARLATVAVGACGGLVCYWWARERLNASSALAALALWTFSPNMIGHGHLMTPDVWAASCAVLAGYQMDRWLRRGASGHVWSLGLSFGLCFLCKTTLFVCLPLIVVILCCLMQDRWNLLRRLLGALALAWIVLLLGYLCESVFVPLGEFEFRSQLLTGTPADSRSGASQGSEPLFATGNRFRGTALRFIPVPLPANLVMGMDVQKWDFERGQWSYLRGQWRRKGWWWYYLYAMATKMPVGYLGLFAVAFATAVRSLVDENARTFVLRTLAPAVVLLGFVSSNTGFNHHLRYVLPAFPFLFVWSTIAVSPHASSHWTRRIAWLCVTLGALESISVLPHSLAFFNQLIGGPKQGHLHLANSNTDWGQELDRVRRWRENHPNAEPFYLRYDMPLIDPSTIGIKYQLPPMDPRANSLAFDEKRVGPHPGWYCVGVNLLHSSKREYDYLMAFEPDEWIGRSMVVFHLKWDEVAIVREEMGLPALRKRGSAAN